MYSETQQRTGHEASSAYGVSHSYEVSSAHEGSSAQVISSPHAASNTQVISRNAFGIKECPICHARCFADMEVCYGCLHSFTEEENQTSAIPTEHIPISLEVKGDLGESDPKTDAVKANNPNAEESLKDVAIRSDSLINEMPPESFKTQVALTDLLEIVISVRTPVKDPGI